MEGDDIITFPLSTAHNILNEFDQQSALQPYADDADSVVQVVPLDEIIIEFVDPFPDTEQKVPSSFAQHIPTHWLSTGNALVTHVIPSSDVIILFVPPQAHAQNSSSSEDQHTLAQLFVVVVCVVQVTPVGDVITPFVPPL